MKKSLVSARNLVLALVLVLPVAAFFSPKAQWRMRLLTYKLSGALSYVGWDDVFKRMYPSKTVFTSAALTPEFSDQLSAKEEGEEPCTILWETPAGPFWGQADDRYPLSYVLGEQIRYSVYEQGNVSVRRGDVVVDVGAHLGVFTRVALEEGAKVVVAFEPHPVHKICFERTFRKEMEEGRVVLVTSAAWETEGELTFFLADSANSSASTVVEEASEVTVEEVTVPATTIDAEVARLNLGRVDFIKMRIMGAEKYALRGARQTIARFRPRMAIGLGEDVEDLVTVPRVVLEAAPDYQIHHRRLVQLYFDPAAANQTESTLTRMSGGANP